MALRSLGSVTRGGIRAWSSSSSPGIQGALGSAARSDSNALHGLAEPARSGAPGFAEPEPPRSGAPGCAEPAKRGALRFASLRGLVAEREDEAFATLTAACFSALFGISYLMKDEDESDEARKNKKTHTAYLLSHQLMEEMEREMASYNKTMPGEKAVVQEYMEDDQAMKARFQEWMKEYGKTYKDEVEKARRYKIFKSVARYVDAANADAVKAGQSVRFGLNKYSDWNADQRARLYGTPTSGDDGHLKIVMSYLAPQWIWHQVAENKEFED